jgi:two-component system chemotaxis response regulator CheY
MLTETQPLAPSYPQGNMTQRDGPSRPPLVLIGIDEEWGARSLDSLLAPSGFAVLRAHTGAQVLDLVRTAQPDAVILDWKLPDLDGPAVCQLLRRSPRFNLATPIFLTATESTGRHQRLAAFEAGAWQFCAQPLDGRALVLQLRTFIEGKRTADDLRELSLVDALTGLYSFRGLARRAREIGAEAARLRLALACIVFAPAQYSAGARGDEEVEGRMAEYLAELFRRCGRLSDAIGRLGPLEFAVVALSTDAPAAARLAHRLRSAATETPLLLQSGEWPFDIHAGYCAISNPADSGVDAVEMLMRATTALRHVQANGNAGAVKSFDQLPSMSR